MTQCSVDRTCGWAQAGDSTDAFNTVTPTEPTMVHGDGDGCGYELLLPGEYKPLAARTTSPTYAVTSTATTAFGEPHASARRYLKYLQQGPLAGDAVSSERDGTPGSSSATSAADVRSVIA